MIEQDTEAYRPITFTFDEEQGQLHALGRAGTDAPRVDQLEQLIAEAGYANLFPLNEARTRLLQQLREGRTHVDLVVAERRDAELQLQISDDALEAHVWLSPAYGGKSVFAEEIQQALADAGVGGGIDQAAIAAIAGQGHAEHMLVARGTPAEHGHDARLESLLTDLKSRQTREDEKGRVNHRALSIFVTVKPGQPLLRKIPASGGTDGFNVRGEPIIAQPGKDVPFTPGGGAEFDPDNPLLIRSTISGHARLSDTGAEVDPILHAGQVDISTGNIEFEGTVQIAGDVAEGMSVKAAGDIQVGGTVSAATLEAGGDIVVAQGVIGRGETRDENGNPGVGIARLRSGGDVSARFMENTLIESARQVTIGELIAHCEINAEDSVSVGGEGGKHGHILGGVTRARHCIRARVLGSQASVKTILITGWNEDIRARLQAVEDDCQDKLAHTDKLHQLLGKLRDEQGEKAEALRQAALNTLEALSDALDSLALRKTQLRARLADTDSAFVEVSERAYAGGHIHIGEGETALRDDTGPGRFFLEGGQIRFS